MEINTNPKQLNKVTQNTSNENKSANNNTPKSSEELNATSTKSENLVDVATSNEKFLKANGFEQNEINKNILKALSNFGVVKNKKNFTTVLNLLRNIGNVKENISTAVFLMTKGLSSDKANLIAKYLNGGLKFSSLLNLINVKHLPLLKSAWLKGNFTTTLLELISGKGEFKDIGSGVKEQLAKDFSENIIAQNLLSSNSSTQNENKIFFQYPIFWNNSVIPDTLEGEASFSGDNNVESGFSLKILASPPTLGNIEIRVNQLSKKIWINIAACSNKSRDLLSTLIQPIHAKLLEQGWKNIKISIIPLVEDMKLHSNNSGFTIQKLSSIDLKG